MDDSTRSAAAGPHRRISAWLFFALLLALPGVARPAAGQCTEPPPRPAGAAVSDAEWKAAVHPNCFDNRQRLGRWTGKAVTMGPTTSPEPYFAAVDANRIAGGTVVVLVHGWAPGFRTAVDKAGGDLRWWSRDAVDSSREWTSDWAWVPTKGTSYPFEVTGNGFFQLLSLHDPDSVVLGYSWLDDSATPDDSWVDLVYVYRSEAYTNLNGLRLADALEQALAPSFWSGPGNRLQLIGHSHGSKVATVATLALRSRGRQVDHLTILDSPERASTVRGNGANFLGYYLDRIPTGNGDQLGGTDTFVDNYISNFGAAYTGSDNAKRVVNVALNAEIFSCTDQVSRHAYAATWYAGAAAAATSFQVPAIGLEWPPAPHDRQPALNQLWSGGITAKNQWLLAAGPPGSIGCAFHAGFCSYSAPTMPIALGKTMGNVSGTPATGLVLTADTGSGVVDSSFAAEVTYSGSQYGIAFQVEWTAPAAGDYLVVTGDTDEGEEVLLVMDGRSAIADRNPVSIAVPVLDYLPFDVYYLPAKTNTAGKVTLTDFQRVEIHGDVCRNIIFAESRPAAAEQAPPPAP
jgi:hypothetical protein